MHTDIWESELSELAVALFWDKASPSFFKIQVIYSTFSVVCVVHLHISLTMMLHTDP